MKIVSFQRCGLATQCMLLLMMAWLPACTSQSPEELRLQANTAIANGDYPTASIHLKNIVQQNPSDVDALAMLADIALTVGNAPSAEPQYRRASDRGATEERIRTGLLESLLELQQFQSVVDAVDPATEPGAAKRAAILVFRGRAYSGLGQLAEAEDQFKAAIELKPGDPATHTYLAEVYRTTGRHSEADEELEKAFAIDPTYPAALLQKALRELALAEPDQAQDTLELAAKFAQENFDKQRLIEQRRSFRILREILYQVANSQLRQGRLEDASVTASRLKELAPDYLLTQFLSAQIATEQNDMANAKGILQRILSGWPDFRPAQRLIGMIYGRERNYTLADMYLTRYVRAVPEDTVARRMLAMVHMSLDEVDEALDLARKTEGGVDEELQQVVLAAAGDASLRSGATDRALELFDEGAQAFPDDQRFAMGRAIALSQAGKADKAIEILEGLPDDQGEDTQRAYVLALAYARSEQFEKAAAIATRMVRDKPEQPISHNLLGTVKFAAGDLDKAYAAFANTLKLEENNQPALVNLATIHQLRDEPDAAAKKLRRVIESYPDDAVARVNLARLNIKRGDSASAMDLLRPIQSKSNKAKLLLSLIDYQRQDLASARKNAADVTRAEPANAAAHNLLGLIELANGSSDAASRSFESAVRIDSNNASFQYNLARAQLDGNRQDAARTSIGELRRLAPQSAQLKFLEMVLFTRDGDYVRAEKLLESLESVDWQPTVRLVVTGELREAQGRYADAVAAYTQAYERQPSLQLAMRTTVLQQAAGSANATALLQDWVTRHPDDVDGLKVLATWQIRNGNFPAAQPSLERILANDPRDTIALNDLAWTYFKIGDKRAMETAQRAYDLNPANAAIADTLGWIQLQSGNAEAALGLLIKAADRAPQEPEIGYHLAIAHRDTGDTESAKRLLNDIVQNHQAFPSRAFAVQALAEL